ncbi:hypothetical protein ADP65_00080 [Achromobacter phage phiAxp-3]|uniref:Uncharacterized protein n=1 Tax=Achromobacter phage phiAxp-3 TaxID=1664247 RepID=A0A0K2FI55_9CAUD|nr:hypothetical protein ADP65_00080 [Achromobacter phage phiAxp-3]ALA45549.1 hypothetical protein ADP65_00080 [Achromobacter phage phiAxp-3]
MITIPEYAAAARIRLTQPSYAGDIGTLRGIQNSDYYKNITVLIPNTELGRMLFGELLLLGYPRSFELIEDRQLLGMNKAVLLLGSTDLYIRYGATLDDQWEVRFYPLPPT